MELTDRLGRAASTQHLPSGIPWLGVASVTAIVVLGALVVVQPALALVLAGGGAFVGVLTGVARVPIAAALVVATIAVVGVVDLPRKIDLGPATSYALITIAISMLLALVSVSPYVLSVVRRTGYLLLPLYAFAAWALVSVIWFRPSFVGAQNTLVYIAFAALVPVTAAAVAHGDLAVATVRRAITAAILLASALYVGSLALGGLGGQAVVGSRSYALLAIVGVAWGVAHVRLGERRFAWLVALCWVLILLSLSRLAFAAAMLIVVVAALDLRTPARFVRSALIVGSVGVVAFFSVTSFGPMAERFAQGDLHTVGGGIAINVEGRASTWDLVWESYLESPIIGKGAGAAEQTIEDQTGVENHPHNDYLRVLHDFGIVGLVLLVAAVGGLMAHAVGASGQARRRGRDASIHLAAGLALLGLLAGMSTDNAIVYLFVVGPVAIILGISIGLQVRDGEVATNPVRSAIDELGGRR